MGSLSLLQGVFPTQGSNTGLQHCRLILYQLSHKRRPREDWSGEPIPSPADIPDAGIEPGSPALQVDSLPFELPRKTQFSRGVWNRPSSVKFSHSVVSDSLRPHGLQHTRLLCPSPTPGAYLNSCPLIGDAIQPSHTLSSPSPPAFNLLQNQGLFHGVSASLQVAKVLEFQLQHQSFQ